MRRINRFPVGTRVKIKEGVSSVEFPDISMQHWGGRILKRSKRLYMLVFDETTLHGMPREYIERCQRRQMAYRYAYLKTSEVEVNESDASSQN